MLSADSHLDLAWSAMDWNRDLTLPVAEIRRLEQEAHPGVKRARLHSVSHTEAAMGTGTVSIPEMRKANMFLALATVLTWVASEEDPKRGYRTMEHAFANGMSHVYYYRALESQGLVRMLSDRKALDAHFAEWEAWERAPQHEQPPLGWVLATEGSDMIMGPWQVQAWWEQGLRVASLVHYGIGPYGHGHNRTEGLTPAGRDLLKEFERIGMILDVTHLSDKSFWEAVDLFDGTVLASHSNCRALVPDPRQFTDVQIKTLIQRRAVIGVAMDDWMLKPDWPTNPPREGAKT